MAIFKAVVHSEYAQIPNSTLQDKSLTFEARGLLAMLLSLPEDWEIHKSWLQGQSVKCGRDKLTRMLKELQDSGYVRKKMNQRDDGKFSDIDWLVYPTAQLKTRSTENPSDGKPATTKETIKQRNKNTNIGTPNGMPCKTCGGVGSLSTFYDDIGASVCHDCQGSGVMDKQLSVYPDQPPATRKVKASNKPKRKAKAQKLADMVLSKPEQWPCLNCLGGEILEEWAKLRSRKGASDSERALNTIEQTLETLRTQHGIAPDQAIAEQLDSGWTTVKVEYFERRKNQQQADGIAPAPNLTPFGGNW